MKTTKTEQQVNTTLYQIEEKSNLRQSSLDIEKNFVAMQNVMVRGQLNMSTNAAKLLRLAIMQIKPNDKELNTLHVAVDQLVDVLSVDRSMIHREVRKAAKELVDKTIYVGGKSARDPWKYFHVVDTCEYKDGMIHLRLSKDIAPFVIDLRNQYVSDREPWTQYRLFEIVQFKSQYSIRIYELIMMGIGEASGGVAEDGPSRNRKPHGSTTGQCYLSLELLRKATGTEKKYERFSQFHSRVMEQALKEINESSPYTVRYTLDKIGKKYIGYFFHVESRIFTALKESQVDEIKPNTESNSVIAVNDATYQESSGQITLNLH